MNKLAIAVLLVSGVAMAGENALPLAVPAGWLDQSDSLDAQATFDQMRSVPMTVSVDGQRWMSPEVDAQLTFVLWKLRPPEKATRTAVTDFDRGLAEGMSPTGAKHVSGGAGWSGSQLFADQVEEVDGNILHQSRIYGVDSDNVIHLLMATCVGARDRLAACDGALKTMRLEVANAIKPIDSGVFVARTESDPVNKDGYYLVGKIVGLCALAGLFGLWYRQKDRRIM